MAAPSDASAVSARVAALRTAVALRASGAAVPDAAAGALVPALAAASLGDSGGAASSAGAPIPIRGLELEGLSLPPKPAAPAQPYNEKYTSWRVAALEAPPGGTAALALRTDAVVAFLPPGGPEAAGMARLLAASGEAPRSGEASAEAGALATVSANAAALRSLAAQQGGALRASAQTGVRPVCEAMTAHVTNAAVQEAGCSALRALAQRCLEAGAARGGLGLAAPPTAPDSAVFDAPLAVEATRACVTAMRAHPDAPGVQAAALGALRTLALVSAATVTAEAVASDGVEPLVALLASQAGAAKSLEQVCKSLEAMSDADDDARRKAVAAGAIAALVRVMQAHPEAPSLAAAALRALVVCVRGDNPATAAEAVGLALRAGAARAATAALTSFLAGSGSLPSAPPPRAAPEASSARANLGGVEAACLLLRLLSATQVSLTMEEAQMAGLNQHIAALANPVDGRSECVRADAVRVLVGALRRHGGDSAACGEDGVSALRQLTAIGSAKAAAAAGGGLEAVVSVMLSHPRAVAVQAACCGALKSLGVLDDVRMRDAAEAAVEALCATLSTHARGHSALAEDACGALCNLTVGSPENAVALSEAGGAAVIAAAMAAHPQLCDVQEAGCAALWSLAAGGAACGSRAAREGGIEAVVKAMSTFASVQTIQVVALAALKNLAACSAENEVHVAAAGGIEAVLEALRSHGSSAALQEVGLEALSAIIASHAAIRRWAFQAGAVEVATAAVATRFPNNEGVKRAAAGALAKLNPLKSGSARLCGFVEI